MITENGWPSCGFDGCDNSKVPGTDVSIPVQIGIPNTILKAFLADLHAFVEPYNGENDWGGWTATNSVATSNHLGGTAVDFNWNDHPMGPEAEEPEAGWQGSSLIDGDEVPAVRDLLNFYEGMVFWGNDWDSPKDSMHFQMGYDTYDNIDKCMDFIGRKIRPDMFSVYRRGGTSQNGTVWPQGATSISSAASTPAPTGRDAAIKALYDAVPVIDMDRAGQLVDAVMTGLALAQCNNVKRIAMWLAQVGFESDGFNATEEYDKSGSYAPYIGRTWIQITWESNYAAFGKWAAAQGLIDDPDYFVGNPAALADMKWAAVGPAWYWTVARPNINAMSDAGDLVGVTEAINGGTNGLTGVENSRTDRYNQAIALGDELLALITPPVTTTTPPGGPLMALTDDEQQEVLDTVRWLKEQLGPNIWGPDSSMGTNAAGQELTVRDGLAAMRRDIGGLLAAKPAAAVAPPKKLPTKKPPAKKAAAPKKTARR
ncbi:M15 family metallopeptidase [Mycobacterium colombiense]